MTASAAKTSAKSGLSGRAILVAAAAAGVFACAVLVIAQINAARQTARASRLSEIALAQPMLAARVGPLAEAALSDANRAGERRRALTELDAVLSRLNDGHESLALFEELDPLSPAGRAVSNADAALFTFVSEARALSSIATLSPASADRRLRAMIERDTPSLIAQLETIARAIDAERASASRRSAGLGVTAAILALAACVVGLIALLTSRSAQAIETPAPARVAPRVINDRVTQLYDAFPAKPAGKPASAPKPSASPAFSFSGEKALVFVRRAQERADIAEALEKAGLKVEARDTLDAARAAAKAAAASGGFDILVCDGVGAMFAARIRAAAAPSNPPLLAIADSSADARALRARGVDVTVRMPVELKDLEAALAFVLQAAPRERRAA